MRVRKKSEGKIKYIICRCYAFKFFLILILFMRFSRKNKVIRIPRDVQIRMAKKTYEKNIDELKKNHPGEYLVICCGEMAVSKDKSDAKWEAHVNSGYYKDREIVGKKLFFSYCL